MPGMAELHLYVGSKRYASWSLRPYLALAHTGAPSRVTTVLLDRDDTRANIAAVSPSGRVPVLHHGDLVVWDSLAICEYLSELYPAAQLWPHDRAERARARAISAEMHSGFGELRKQMPMDIGGAHPGKGHTPEALADAARIQAIWRDALARSGGPFLFGAFTIADAMFAPVVTRFTTYRVTVDDVGRRYMETVAGLPAMKQWAADAASEPQAR